VSLNPSITERVAAGVAESALAAMVAASVHSINVIFEFMQVPPTPDVFLITRYTVNTRPQSCLHPTKLRYRYRRQTEYIRESFDKPEA